MELKDKILKGVVLTAYSGLLLGLLRCNTGCAVVREFKEENHHVMYDTTNEEKGFRIIAYDFNENGIPEKIEHLKYAGKNKPLERKFTYHDWDEDGVPDLGEDEKGNYVNFFLKDDRDNFNYGEGNFMLDSFKKYNSKYMSKYLKEKNSEKKNKSKKKNETKKKN